MQIQYVLKSSVSQKFLTRLTQLMYNYGKRTVLYIFSGVLSPQNYDIQASDFQQFYSNVEEWQAYYFVILTSKTLNKETKVMNWASQIKFSCLQVLALQNTVMTSIQFLQWIDCQKIKILQISTPNVVTYKSLGKTKFNDLELVQLHKNILQGRSIEVLSRTKTHQFISNLPMIIQDNMTSDIYLNYSNTQITPKLQGRSTKYMWMAMAPRKIYEAILRKFTIRENN